MLLKPGSTWKSRYQILSLIGEGGFATVYHAKDLELGREIAIKMLKSSSCHDAETMARFKREAHLLGKLSHKNIVSVYSYEFFADSMPCITMEYMQGESLERKVNNEGPLEPRLCLQIFSEIADALSFAHSFGIIHRDLNCANIFLAQEGDRVTAKVIDFGVSALLSRDNQESIDKLTATGMLIGSPAYMSPEQTRGERLDVSSDIYSLGCTLYKAASGEMAFESSSSTGFLYMHQNQYPKAPVIGWSDQRAAEKVEKITLRCLQKDPAKRFKNAADFKSALNSNELDRQSKTDLAPWSDLQPQTKGLRPGLLATALLISVLVLPASQLTFLEKQFAKLLTFLPGQSSLPLEKWFVDQAKDPDTRIELLSDMLNKTPADSESYLPTEFSLCRQYLTVNNQKAAVGRLEQALTQIARIKNHKDKQEQLDSAIALIQQCNLPELQSDLVGLLARCLEESLQTRKGIFKGKQILQLIFDKTQQKVNHRIAEDKLTMAATAIAKLFKAGRITLSDGEHRRLSDLRALMLAKDAFSLAKLQLGNSGTPEYQKSKLFMSMLWANIALNPKQANLQTVQQSKLDHSIPLYQDICIAYAVDDGDLEACRSIWQAAKKIPTSETSKIVLLCALGEMEKANKICAQLCQNLPAEFDDQAWMQAADILSNFESALTASNYVDDKNLGISILKKYASFLPGTLRGWRLPPLDNNHKQIANKIVGFRSPEKIQAAQALADSCSGKFRDAIVRAVYEAKIYSALDAKQYTLANEISCEMKKQVPDKTNENNSHYIHLQSLIECGLGNIELARSMHNRIVEEYKSGSENIIRSDLWNIFQRRQAEMIEIAIDSKHEELACQCLKEVLSDRTAAPSKRFAIILAPEMARIQSAELKGLLKQVLTESGYKESVVHQRVVIDRLAFTRVRHK